MMTFMNPEFFLDKFTSQNLKFFSQRKKL